MIRGPPDVTPTDPRLPYTTLFRSQDRRFGGFEPAPKMLEPLDQRAQLPSRNPIEIQPGQAGDSALGHIQRARRSVVGVDDSHVAVLLRARDRSEEHTSELQSLMRISYAVFCLNKKKQ